MRQRKFLFERRIFIHPSLIKFLPLFFLFLTTTTHASPWSEGNKTLLYIRADFSDLSADPIAKDEAEKILAQVAAFYHANSYGKLNATFTVTPTLRLPHPAALYETNHEKFNRLDDARKLAKAAGFDPDHYDFDAIAFKRKGPGSSAVGGVGSKGLWLDNIFDFGATAHEFGHNLGLLHANLWATWDGSVIGPGHHQDYGDENDIMGAGAGDPRKHTSVPFKAMVGWLTDTDITTISRSGIYQLYAQDIPGPASARALKIIRDPENTYWIEYRQLLTENRFNMNGARILRQYSSDHGMDLLDMTPETHTGNDGALLLGRTFSDFEAGIHVTPIAKKDTTPPLLDVLINLGKFPNNHPPIIKSLTSRPLPNSPQTIELKIIAVDPDRDPLQYSWDFGDGTFGWGTNTITHIWPATNADFLVRCIVTDMKGGTASRSLPVQIGEPKTVRLTGTIMNGRKPLPNILIQANPTHSALTDSDGKFQLVGLELGDTRISAEKPGYIFKPQQVTAPTSASIDFKPFPPTATGAIVCPEGITIEGNERFATPQSFRPPVDIFIVARTDSNNLRLAYAADQVIFNWEVDETELRIDGGPADGHHKKGAGAIPKDRDVVIRWVVTPKAQSIFVDGELRFNHLGDYSKLDRPIWISTHNAKVTIKSIAVKRGP